MLKIHNTLSRKLEEFRPLQDTRVRMYTCGPTVYDFAHIGNWRAFVFYDLVKRYLTYRGFAVEHVMNITDVDDKIIKKCNEQGKTLSEFTQPFLHAFLNDAKKLRVSFAGAPEQGVPKTTIVKATDSIEPMVKLVQQLINKKIAYKAGDGSVYYSIETFPAYGQLARLDKKGLKPGARVSHDEYEKQALADFALWKAYAPEDGKIYWDTPIGKGRPGWHLECSAMAMNELGPTIDLHLGGVDLVFPHHENEIAQSEGATGKTFCNYWLHCNHLMVNGEKMAKSKGNFYTLRDLSQFKPEAVRHVLLNANYAQSLNFTFETVRAAESVIERLNDFIARVQKANGTENPAVTQWVDDAQKGFENAMDNDLNVPNALAAVFELQKKVNTALDDNKLGTTNAKNVLDFLKRIDAVLAVMDFSQTADELSAEEQALVAKRTEFKAKKMWKEADEIRDELAKRGITLSDTKTGIAWKREKR